MQEHCQSARQDPQFAAISMGAEPLQKQLPPGDIDTGRDNAEPSNATDATACSVPVARVDCGDDATRTVTMRLGPCQAGGATGPRHGLPTKECGPVWRQFDCFLSRVSSCFFVVSESARRGRGRRSTIGPPGPWATGESRASKYKEDCSRAAVLRVSLVGDNPRVHL